MILAVDAGNTAVTLGCVEGREILNLARLAASPGRSADEYAVLMERVLSLRGVKLREFEGAAIASVVPPLTEVLREAVRLITGHDALVVGAGVKTGLNIGIDDPSQMGADLVAGAVAALDAHEPPVIIIDMGTATTITVIGPNSRLLGGAILPGAAVSLEALSDAEAGPSAPSSPPPMPPITKSSTTSSTTAAPMMMMYSRFSRQKGSSARWAPWKVTASASSSNRSGG